MMQKYGQKTTPTNGLHSLLVCRFYNNQLIRRIRKKPKAVALYLMDADIAYEANNIQRGTTLSI
jgi:hypothetical protein